MNISNQHINKKGYLNNDYLVFSLCDRKNDEHSFHYHEFDKIVIMLSGNTSYIIEGKEYFLQPNDILLVNHHDIHMPVIDSSSDYKRIVIWINRDFMSSRSNENNKLDLCFRIASERSVSLIRPDENDSSLIFTALSSLLSAYDSSEYGSKLYSDCCLMQFLTLLNRNSIRHSGFSIEENCKYDRKINEILKFINSNLNSELSCEEIADKFFISKSYLMHKFKTETGYTLHNYILQKRLLYSKTLLEQGCNVNEAALASGFTDYTTFLRAFKKLFYCLPSDFS